MNLSVIIPTVNRPFVCQTILSVFAAGPGDDTEIVVVADGPSPLAWLACRRMGLPCQYHELPDGPHHDYGAAARTRGMETARGRWLAFMDDDDVYLPGGLAAVRRAVRGPAVKPFLFRMDHPGVGGVIWRQPEVRCGNVSSQMIVCLNDPERLGTWGAHYTADHDFIARTVELHGGAFWREEVIARWARGRQ
jgi:glycosyltransferase involved in cell wall biosynthesis